MRPIAAVALVVAVAGCTFGRGERTPTRAAPSEEWTRGISVRCAAKALRVEFDPRARVVVTSGGTRLAAATFTSHGLNDRCRHVPHTCCDHEGPGVIVYSQLRLRCVLGQRAEISVQAIVNEARRRVGTNVVVAVRGQPMVSALLKHRGEARASSLWFATPWCTRVS